MALMARFIIGVCVLAALTVGSAFAQDGQTVPHAEPDFSTKNDLFVQTDAPIIESTAVSPPEPVLYEALDEETMQRAFRRMKRDADAQWELRTDLPERPDPPGWAQAVGRFLSAVIEFLTPLLKVIFWLGLGALALVFVYAIVTSLRGIIQDRKTVKEDEIIPEYRPSAKAARVLLEDADALAAQGRFAEAIHLILYRSIQDIEKARPDAIRLSLTSREIARSPALGPQTRTIFAAIARYVERSHFGGRAVDADDYAAARTLYAQLTNPSAKSTSPRAEPGVSAVGAPT
jgi:hypothetical protein